jgi:two-component system nitrate/nitrite response regulator NarL
MKAALFTSPGLFTDGLCHILAGLGTDIAAQRYDFEALDPAGAEFDFALVDIDAARPRKPAAMLAELLDRIPNAPMVALGTRIDEEAVAAVIRAGAAGYIAKSFGEEQALGVLRAVLEKSGVVPSRRVDSSASERGDTEVPLGRNGRPYGLTQREMEVLSLLAMRLANKQIANRLGIVEGVVKVHLHHAYEKLGVRSRIEALALAQQIDQIRKLEVEGAGDVASLRQWLLPHMLSESKRKGEVLFRKGDPGKALYFIQKGQVRLPELGKLVGEGQLLGEIGIFSAEKRRTSSAQCETDARLFRLEADHARTLFFANPQFAFQLMQLAAQRVSVAQDRIR